MMHYEQGITLKMIDGRRFFILPDILSWRDDRGRCGSQTAKAEMQSVHNHWRNVVKANACQSQMTWDYAQRRVALSASGGDTWQFIYDPTASVPSVLAEVKNGTVEAFYVREPDGQLLARVAGSARQYYFFDGLGSTQAICPVSEGNPTDRYFYTPWGEPDTRTESLSGTPGNPYRYVGQLGYYTHHQDANLADWMELGVRFYDPEIGRFERRDPVEQPRFCAYGYVASQLLRQVDPAGLASRDLTDPEWKVVNCHLRGLCACLPPPRGNDWGYEKLREHICRYKDSRDKYHYDPEYPEYARTKPEIYGWWPGLLLGGGSASALCGCRYEERFAVTLVHEFMHFNDGYWYPYIRAGFGVPYTGEDPHIYYDNYARMFVGGALNCLRASVGRCCK